MTAKPRTVGKRVAPWLIDGLVVTLIISSAFLPFDGPFRANLIALPWLAAASVAFLFRRRWPLPALVVGVAIFIAASFAGLSSPAMVIAPAMSVYQVSVSYSRAVAVPVTVSTAVVLALASLSSLPLGLENSEFLLAQAIPVAAVTGFAGAFGDAAKSRRSTLAAYEERALKAEQTKESEARTRVAEDRLQIARDLHDLIAHQIAVINLHANVASRAIPDRPGEAQSSITVIRDASKTVLTEISELLSALRDSSGEGSSPNNLSLSQLEELLGQFRANGLTIVLTRVGPAPALSAFGDSVAYRVLQEALTNALKHSADQTCTVELVSTPGECTITVENPVESSAVTREVSGHGITGMRERIAIIGGSLEVENLPTIFRMTAIVPAATAPEAT